MKKIIVLPLVFIAIVYEKREKYMLYMSKNTFKQHADSLIIKEKLNIFLSNVLILSCMIMYYVIEKTHSCRNCLQGFSTEEILKSDVNDSFKVNVQQMIQKSKGRKMLNSKIMKEKQNHHVRFMQILKVFWLCKIIKRKIQMNLIRAKIIKVLLAVMAVN